MKVPLAIAAMLAVCIPARSLTNIIRNPSFEGRVNAEGIAEGWTGSVHDYEGAQGGFAGDGKVKRTGLVSQRIDHTSDNSAWVRVNQEPVPVKPDTQYRIALWARGSGAFAAVVYEFRGSLGYLTHYVASSQPAADWQQYDKLFTTTSEARHLKVSLICNGRGSAWFDDVSLVQIGERPHLRVAPVRSGPRADGDLSDPAWAGAPRASAFLVLSGDGQTAPVRTEARLTIDDKAVYLAFECEEPNMDGLVAQHPTDEPSVWADDVVEVFLDLNHDRSGYLHLGVSAAGGKWQERVESDLRYADWYSFGGGKGDVPTWTAATRLAEDRWFAEMSLPLKQLGVKPAPGKLWGLQLCRTRRAAGQQQHSTWSYTPGERFAAPERFGTLSFRLEPTGEPLMVQRPVRDDTAEPLIIPRPAKCRWGEGSLSLQHAVAIRISDRAQQSEAQLLSEQLRTRFGLDARILISPRCPDASGIIDLDAPHTAYLPDDDEGYRLTIGERGVCVEARSARGRLYAVQTLRQMLQKHALGASCRRADIIDAPMVKWRAWHMASPAAEDIPFYERLVDTLSVLKFNTIVWEVNDQLQYESHPAVAREGAPTKAQLAALVQYAKRRHFEVIPQLASYSHFGYVLSKDGYRHLAESPQTTLGVRSLFNYCPSKPETYEVVLDLMSEVRQVFRPKYFHIGHDESVYDDIGVCELCKDTEPWELWARDITRLNDWIKARGMRTIMWGDQFLQEHTGGEPYHTARAVDKVDKGIIIFDWHYSPNHAYDGTLGFFKEHGFDVVGCPWYEPLNVYRYASAVVANDALGFCGSTWSGVSGTRMNMPHMPAAWVTGAENTWSTNAPDIADFPYQPVVQFNRLWRMDDPDLPSRFRLIDLSAYCNETTVDTRRRTGWMAEGPAQDLRELPAGVTWVGDVPFGIVEGASQGQRACLFLADETTPAGLYPMTVHDIPIDVTTPRLYFLHTCSVPPGRERQLYARGNPRVIGSYRVHYADGEQVSVPLRYQANIHDWNSQRGPAQALGLWQGRTRGGALATLGAIEWVNPRPAVAIQSIDFCSTGGPVKPVLMAISADG